VTSDPSIHPAPAAAAQAKARPRAPERLLVAYARHFPVRRGKMRIVDALWRTVAGGDSHRLAVIRYGGLQMPCDLSETLQRQYYFFGTYFLEETNLEAWMVAARGARTVFDVGANSGIYSLAALAAKPDADVHAFEPTPEIAERLRQTVALNGLDRLVVHQTAVFSKDGLATLRRYGSDAGGNEGMNFIVSDLGGADAEHVPTIRLDTACRQLGVDRIDLLKLDIQGHEAGALAGAGALLTEGRVGTLFMELNWDEGDDCPASQAIRLLEEAGYLFAAPARRMTFKPAGDWMRRLSDIVARRPEPG
jgi:FkbM family methyltransferase